MSNGQTVITITVDTSGDVQVPQTDAAALVAQFKAELPHNPYVTKRVIFKNGRAVFSKADLPSNVEFTFDDDGVLIDAQVL
jgi:hypothetical protein